MLNQSVLDLWNCVIEEVLKGDSFSENDIVENLDDALCVRIFTEELLELGVPNKFQKAWLETKYAESIATVIKTKIGWTPKIEFVTDAKLFQRFTAKIKAHEKENASIREAITATSKPKKKHKKLVLNNAYTFDSFVSGVNTDLALEGCRYVVENISGASNPLFLWGGSGLGKTHLLHATCNAIIEKYPEKRIEMLTCETFTNDFMKASYTKSWESFRHRFRNVDVLIIDDIHFMASKEGTQKEFLETFSHLYENGAQIILSSDISPVEQKGFHEKIRSRFVSGLSIEMRLPTTQTRADIATKKALTLGAEITQAAATAVANRCLNSVREIEGAVKTLSVYAMMKSTVIDINIVDAVLSRKVVSAAHTIRHNPDAIIEKVCSEFGLMDMVVKSASRRPSVAECRSVAMYFIRELTNLSLSEIGMLFEKRSHSTVNYSVKKIEKAIKTDPILSQTIESLRNELTKKD